MKRYIKLYILFYRKQNYHYLLGNKISNIVRPKTNILKSLIKLKENLIWTKNKTN